MSVTVDDEPLAAETLGLATVGQVLTHLRARNRLVVHVMIDGREPDFAQMESLRAQPVGERTVYIETVEPQRIAAEVFEQVERSLDEADALREPIVESIRAGDPVTAMKKLGTCFTTWGHAQSSIEQVAKLLRIDLDRIDVDQTTLAAWLATFAGQLNEIRGALENRDYPLLADLLTYETQDANDQWRAAIDAIRKTLD